MRSISLALMLLLAASTVLGGEVFGTITDGKKPVSEGTKVEITLSGKSITVETDKFGSYRLVVKEKGKGTITVHIRDQSPSVEFFSYDKSTRYDWILESKDGKLILRRK
jgi:hypothetical protein